MVLRGSRSSHIPWHAGEQLSAGWEPLLRILEAVPEGGDAPCVSLAFQSVQLLASDYMSALPPPLLRQCLQAAALYGGQQVGASTAHALCSANSPAAVWLSDTELASPGICSSSCSPLRYAVACNAPDFGS